MDGAAELLHRLLVAVVRLLINPLYYVGILLVVLQYRRQIKLERRLFSQRLHSVLGETWRAVAWGALGGLAASVAMALLGATVAPETMWLLWAVSILLMLVRIRFMCLSYAIGAVGMLRALLAFVPDTFDAQLGGASALLAALRQVDVASLLAIAGVLHILEGALIRGQGTRMATPMFYEGKRGKIIGGYGLQGFWPVPLLLIVPLSGGSELTLPWATVFGGGWSSGWTVLSLPFMIGFTELTLSGLPRDKARRSFVWLVSYGLVLLLLGLAVRFWSPLAFAACLLAIVLHEALIWYGRWSEEKRTPLYIHNERGLRVLAVFPGSSAAELGIVPGEIIHKVNGMKVLKRADLHQAMQLNPAFTKLEVVNLQGEIKFVSRPLYANEHHQLGLVLAPDEQAMYYVEAREQGLLAYLGRRLAGLVSPGTSAPRQQRDLS
jgi:hypothetical protein